MPVSGVVIQVDPAQRSAIVASLSAMESLEVVNPEESLPEAPLVAVIEVPTIAEEEALFQQINGLEGVRTVTLSYHNFEDLADHQLQ